MSAFGPELHWQGAGGWTFQMRGIQIAGLSDEDLDEMRAVLDARGPRMAPGQRYDWSLPVDKETNR